MRESRTVPLRTVTGGRSLPTPRTGSDLRLSESSLRLPAIGRAANISQLPRPWKQRVATILEGRGCVRCVSSSEKTSP